jgi:hypothetical protein
VDAKRVPPETDDRTAFETPSADPSGLSGWSRLYLGRTTTRRLVGNNAEWTRDLGKRLLLASSVEAEVLEAFLLTRAPIGEQGPDPRHLQFPDLHHDRSTCELAHADTQADGEIVGGRRTQCRCAPPDAEMPAEYGESVLNDPQVAAKPGVPIQQRRLADLAVSTYVRFAPQAVIR